MNQKTLIDAILEANRFTEKAQKALWELQKMKQQSYICGTNKSAAARRASMDLTRALAEMRSMKDHHQ
jgi:hypothetical protein